MSRSSRSAINAGVYGGLTKEEKALGYMRKKKMVHKSDSWRELFDSHIPYSRDLNFLIAIEHGKNQKQSGISVEAEDWITLYLQ
eukprot:scaffold74877_cov38-Cyclotella_meneghiniana.AAC.8